MLLRESIIRLELCKIFEKDIKEEEISTYIDLLKNIDGSSFKRLKELLDGKENETRN